MGIDPSIIDLHYRFAHHCEIVILSFGLELLNINPHFRRVNDRFISFKNGQTRFSQKEPLFELWPGAFSSYPPML
jgi:hypothetical protein